MKRLALLAGSLLVLAGGSASAAPVRLTVTPAAVRPGGAVTVGATASPCLPGDQVTLISAAFRGRAFGGEGAVYGRVGPNGSFAVPTHVRTGLRPGRYEISVRCGGGNLGVSAFVRVAAAHRLSLAVYLVGDEHVLPVRRTAPHTVAVARAALQALLAGPTAAERRRGYTTAIPAGTRLLGLSLARGVLTVDLTRRFQSGGGSSSMLLRVAQIVYTATRFPSIERVAFRLDGKPVNAIGGEGVMVAPPVGRAAFEAQAPPILVERPLPGDRVTAPLAVRGTANVFEAQLFVDITTADGRLLAHRGVRATSGTGTRGSFDVRIPLKAQAAHLVVVAYARSPRDNARIDLVRVPVTLDRPHRP